MIIIIACLKKVAPKKYVTLLLSWPGINSRLLFIFVKHIINSNVTSN